MRRERALVGVLSIELDALNARPRRRPGGPDAVIEDYWRTRAEEPPAEPGQAHCPAESGRDRMLDSSARIDRRLIDPGTTDRSTASALGDLD